ncbi:MAG TPA: hypothetical protein VK769_01540, partial [Verrucomicrobiae bacterium]|nr:hypothetical protein [Verrucomicrobiae bacterium]
MNQTPKTKSVGRLRRAFFIWLMFFAAIVAMFAVADLAAAKNGIRIRAQSSEIIYSIIIASISLA